MTAVDLTAITTPFGLLDEATQQALRDCGGPWEVVSDSGRWDDTSQTPTFYGGNTYRLKPQPPKPREWWATNQIMHESESKAMVFRDALIADNPNMSFPPIVHVREVIE